MTSVTNPTVEDGDCRYLPKEILSDDYEHLTKADIFSLGLTMYQAVSYPMATCNLLVFSKATIRTALSGQYLMITFMLTKFSKANCRNHFGQHLEATGILMLSDLSESLCLVGLN